jgi:hypothetical protein
MICEYDFALIPAVAIAAAAAVSMNLRRSILLSSCFIS